MPTLLRLNGFQFVIYPNDHEPPHVHIFRAGAELIIILGVDGDEPVIREVFSTRNRDIASAFAVTRENNDDFLARWEEVCRSSRKK